MLALEEMISSIIVVILFNIWKFSVGRKDVHYGIGLGYHTLRILVVVLLFPFFLDDMDYHSDNNDCCSDAKQRQPCINNALKYSIPFNVFRHILYSSIRLF